MLIELGWLGVNYLVTLVNFFVFSSSFFWLGREGREVDKKETRSCKYDWVGSWMRDWWGSIASFHSAFVRFMVLLEQKQMKNNLW